jgi:hypothetical protein
VNDEKLMLKYTMELEHVIVWICGFVLEKYGSAFYNGGEKLQLSLLTP